jgi:hypothetical protein
MQCRYGILISVWSLGLGQCQTQVDLSKQSKSVDFSAANTTKPFKAGTVLPATCGVAETFFQTNAPAGLNLYACTAVNSWTLLSGAGISGLSIALNGTMQGTQSTLNFIAGTGIVQSCVNNVGASRVDCTPSFNSALIPTHDTIHANENYCASSNGSVSYTCSMPNKVLAAYSVGQSFLLNVDATCTTACTLSIDNLGPKSVKKKDGVTDPGGVLVAGQAQFVWYDGTIFRLMYF